MAKGIVAVHNITDQIIVYRIEEDNIRRKFTGFETKNVPVDELRKLYYIPGGVELLHEYLCVEDRDLAHEFGVPDDMVEYYWTQADVDRVLTIGSIEELEDALEFGPLGIRDLIQDRAIALKINDLNKRNVIDKYLGIDITNIINNAEDDNTEAPEPTTRGRRVSRS